MDPKDVFYSYTVKKDDGKRSMISYMLLAAFGAVVGIFAMYVLIFISAGALVLVGMLFIWLPTYMSIILMGITFLALNGGVVFGVYIVLKRIDTTNKQKIVFFAAYFIAYLIYLILLFGN